MTQDTNCHSNETPCPQPPMFRLVVGDNKPIISGDVAVRWCVNKATLDLLVQQGAIDPHILLVSVDDMGREKLRVLEPLSNMIAFYRFTRPGEARLHAFIVWKRHTSDGDPITSTGQHRRELKKRYLRKIDRNYYTDILDYTCDMSLEGTYQKRIETRKPYSDFCDHYTYCDVELPKDVFGKEPSGWISDFANLWHEGTVQDECHFRRRLIIACTLKIWPMMAIILIKYILFLIAAVGVSSIGLWHRVIWKIFIHPTRVWYNDASGVVDLPYEFTILEDSYLTFKGKVLFPMMLSGPIVILCTMVAFFVKAVMKEPFTGYDLFVEAATLMVLTGLFIFVFFDLMGLIISYWSKNHISKKLIRQLTRVIHLFPEKQYQNNFEETMNRDKTKFDLLSKNVKNIWNKSQVNKLKQYKTELQTQVLTCPSVMDKEFIADIEKLPNGVAKYKLYASKMKNLVCKPMPQ